MRLKTKKKKRSTDKLVLVLVIALIALIAIFYRKAHTPSADAEKISAMIAGHHGVSFVNNGVIDEKMMKVVSQMDYAELKSFFNVTEDFCIYIEDGRGNLMLSKGTSKLNKDGIYCKE